MSDAYLEERGWPDGDISGYIDAGLRLQSAGDIQFAVLKLTAPHLESLTITRVIWAGGRVRSSQL